MIKRKYYIRAENNITGKVVQSSNIICFDIGNVIKILGKHGYIVNKQYEIFKRMKG